MATPTETEYTDEVAVTVPTGVDIGLVLRLTGAIFRYGADFEADYYGGQSPVENWLLAALDNALRANTEKAQQLLDKYEPLEWEQRVEFQWDEGDYTEDEDEESDDDGD